MSNCSVNTTAAEAKTTQIRTIDDINQYNIVAYVMLDESKGDIRYRCMKCSNIIRPDNVCTLDGMLYTEICAKCEMIKHLKYTEFPRNSYRAVAPCRVGEEERYRCTKCHRIVDKSAKINHYDNYSYISKCYGCSLYYPDKRDIVNTFQHLYDVSLPKIPPQQEITSSIPSDDVYEFVD
jgi:hypothetical protein